MSNETSLRKDIDKAEEAIQIILETLIERHGDMEFNISVHQLLQLDIECEKNVELTIVKLNPQKK